MHPDNPSVKTDGTAFPTYLINAFDEPLSQVLEKYSTTEYTQDTPYYYYLDINNKLVWKPKINVPLYILNEEDCNSIDLTDNDANIINYVKIYCGQDARGVGINASYIDYGSVGRHGARGHYLTSTNNISTSIMQNEVSTNSASFDINNNGWFPTSYPYTTAWGTTCSNDSDYNEAIITRATILGTAKGKSIVIESSETKKSATINIPITLNYSQGELIRLIAPTNNYNNTMRIEDIQWGSYNTILTLKEDKQN
jgi:hypothetical protein